MHVSETKYNVFTLIAAARAMEDAPVVAERRENEDEIVLKVQSAFWRKGRELRIGKSEPMRVLILMCAEELKCDANSIKLVYENNKFNEFHENLSTEH